ncbi:M12 family metallo-peptidase [Nocardioides renjunii]|uniref:M12 family metallo-peptidase n=1 Tax=Nocardioides renjunii TaxID=3095075 RepID=UPI002AFDD2B1|nr:M12 family metallo-peptidase [Nocardioides sp. S-34]WQQ21957.1 M12 family metallo-peptidase [Nocardioides sp. S-34]
MVGIAGLCTIALAATAAPLPTAVASPAERDRPVELLEAASATTKAGGSGERSRAVELDPAALAGTRADDRLTLDLFDDTSVTAEIGERTTVDGITSWTGTLVGTTGTFSAVEAGGVFHVSLASAEDGSFEVSSTRDGGYEAVEIAATTAAGDDAVRPEDQHGHEHEHAGSERRGRVHPAAAADDPSVIDVAIVYPASLPATVGAPAMQAQFALGITQTNQALAASGVSTTVRLVGTRQVAAAQLSTLTANYYALGTAGDGVFDEAQALREETHADLVSLWLGGTYPSGTTCGLGSLGGTNPQYDPDRAAWTVVWADRCATGNLTFAHELGHNLSADHDAAASAPPNGSKPYARGYVDAAGAFTTVMAYANSCPTCTRIGYFSNPAVLYNARPTGTPAANNAQAIAEQISAVANYRQSQIYPGAVSIAGQARWKGKAAASTTPWAPAVTLGYQWFLDGSPVAGATEGTFRLKRRDIGSTLTLRVTGSAPYYPAAIADTGPVVVGKALFKTKRPKLRGLPRAGRVLSASVKGWKPKPSKKSVKVRYQWLKNGKKIKGAKKSTYRVRAKDRGKKISVKVTVKAKGYDKAKRSSKKVKIRR